MNSIRWLAIAISLVFACSANAITPGQTDDFQDGTTNAWINGPFAPQVENIVTGGPAGVDDHYMRVTATGGGGPGSRLTTFNHVQWLGDYVGQGITAIEMDLNNFSDTALNIRIAFKAETSISSPGFLSQGFTLPAGGGWEHVVFAINMASMIPINSPGDFNTFFSGNFQELRIINEAGQSNMNGDPVIGMLGIDNIHAVPEPNSTLLAAIGLVAIFAVKLYARRAK